ncbi:MAG TPA: hypothetical protein VFZ26_17250 [Gemmatimonadales bacterium]
MRRTGWVAATLVAVGIAARPAGAAAQADDRVNIYRYILDIDVPEPAALVALGLAPAHVLRASAPKPIAAHLSFAFDSGGATTRSAVLEVSPYFLAGGGIRSLRSYRTMTLWGRVRRVLTKTIVSLGAAGDPADPGAARLGLALRSTFHDPHDPIPPPGGLVEQVDSALAGAGLGPELDEEDLAERGVDLGPLYARARRDMRARRGIQIAGGWGLAGRLEDGNFGGLRQVRHTLWFTTQYTFGPRFDLLGTAQLWNGFDDSHVRVGAALMRKTAALDLTTELYFDSADDRLHLGGWVEGRILPRLRAAASLATETDPGGGPNRLRMRTLIRWSVAQRP